MAKTSSIKSHPKGSRHRKTKVVSPPGKFQTIAERGPVHSVESYLWKPLGATLPEVLEAQFQWDVRTSRGCQTHWPWVAAARRWGRARLVAPSPEALPLNMSTGRRNTLDGPETVLTSVNPELTLPDMPPYRQDSEEMTLVTAESIRHMLKSSVFADQKSTDDEELPPGIPRPKSDKATDTSELLFDPFDPNMKYTKIPTTIMPAYIPAEVQAAIKTLPNEETAFMAYAREQDEMNRSKKSSKTDIVAPSSALAGADAENADPPEVEDANENENKCVANKNANKSIMDKETEMKMLFPTLEKPLTKKNKKSSDSSAAGEKKRAQPVLKTKPQIKVKESDDVIHVRYVKSEGKTTTASSKEKVVKDSDDVIHVSYVSTKAKTTAANSNKRVQKSDNINGRSGYRYNMSSFTPGNIGLHNGLYKPENQLSAAALARGYKPPMGLPPIQETGQRTSARRPTKGGDDSAFSEPSSFIGRRKTKRSK